MVVFFSLILFACSSNDDADSGTDSGVVDEVGVVDTGSVDDVGIVDSGTDAGVLDLGVVDTGVHPDAAIEDTGTQDSGNTSEVCDNGSDDDADGRFDCDDDECFGSSACAAVSVHVAKTGRNNESCGTFTSPCLTIRIGLEQASNGQTIYVHAGTYDESWIVMKTGTRLYSADGPLTAKINSNESSAVRFDGITDAELDGFEVYGNYNQGSPGDGLVRVLDSARIVLRNAVLHDAPYDCDVVKVSGQVDDLLLEGLVVYNPAQRTNGAPCAPNPCYQENIDIFGSGAQANDPPPVSNVVLRNSWLFHTQTGGDFLIYSKINVEKIMYENNLFGPSDGSGWGNAAVGIGTGEVGIPDANDYVIRQAIVRNNIFVGLNGDAALGIYNADNTWIYNNTFWGNSGSGLRSVVMFRGNGHELGQVDLFNNLFVNNHPSKSGARLIWNRNNLPSPFFIGHNLFANNIVASDVVVTGEPNSLYEQDPHLAAPAIPDTTTIDLAQIRTWAEKFIHASGAASANHGLDAVGRSGHPNWRPGDTDRRTDLRNQSRPTADTWDLGAFEVEY